MSEGRGEEAAGGGPSMSEDEIDSNLEETFPASDPPSWTLGVDPHHGDGAENESDSPHGAGSPTNDD